MYFPIVQNAVASCQFIARWRTVVKNVISQWVDGDRNKCSLHKLELFMKEIKGEVGELYGADSDKPVRTVIS
jgi:hypothetical protein